MDNLDNLFDGIDQIKISMQKINKKLHVNLIKRVSTKYNPQSYFLLDRVNNCCYYANSLLTAFINKIIDKLEHEGPYYFKNKELDDILSFKITGEEVKRGKTMQTFDIKTLINGNVNTIKNNKVLELGANDLED